MSGPTNRATRIMPENNNVYKTKWKKTRIKKNITKIHMLFFSDIKS